MKIISLTASNIKKLKAIEIKPNSNFVQITGRNAQGKTSVLDCIWYALGGKESIDVKPIREGQEKAVIKIDLDEFVVIRTFKQTDNGTTTSLVIESKDGAKYPSPQAMLDNIIGKLSFDPLAFTKMKAKDQFDKLKEIANIDFDFEEYKFKEKQIYEERTVINREIKQLESSINSIIIDEKLGDTFVDTSALMNEISEIEHYNVEQINRETTRETLLSKINNLKKEIITINETINSILVMPLKDVEELRRKMSMSSLINNNVSNIHLKKDKENRLKEVIAKSEQRTNLLNNMISCKNEIIKNAKMPIAGLTIDDGQVIFNNIPLQQSSGAEQLKISMAIAMAANPKLRVIRIADGSLLDDTSMKEIEEIAIENDYQIWIERVDNSGTTGVYIENGEIK